MNRSRVPGILAGVILLLAGLDVYQYRVHIVQMRALRAELSTTQEEALETQEQLQDSLAQKTEESIALAGQLRLEQMKTGSFASQLKDLSGTIGSLEKLAKTDPELLAKYSRVYFLNENYAPPALRPVAKEYGFQPERTYEVHAEVAPRLNVLLKDAHEDGLSLLVASAFRSFGEQASLKSSYAVRYGSGANAFSADQGYSEHQLGTTIDFTTPSVGGTFAGFDKTKEYAWLMENAWRYGFILSYPKGNTYYQYEPWHWRYVGKELAKRLHEDGQDFYDLDQRTIDTYLVNIFD